MFICCPTIRLKNEPSHRISFSETNNIKRSAVKFGHHATGNVFTILHFVCKSSDDRVKYYDFTMPVRLSVNNLNIVNTVTYSHFTHLNLIIRQITAVAGNESLK